MVGLEMCAHPMLGSSVFYLQVTSDLYVSKTLCAMYVKFARCEGN